MKSILISALALGAMTSVALAEEPLKPIAAQPMELSLAQLDDVTAGTRDRKNKKKHKFNKVEIDVEIDIENNFDVKCKNCKVEVENNVNVEIEL
jgi:hypothetical protein